MGWRDYAKEVRGSGDNRDERDKSPETGPIGPIVPNVPPPLDPVRAMKLCGNALGTLDHAKPRHGLDPARWRQMLDDAQWLLDAYGPAAFRNGWTVPDLFGLWWWQDGDALALKSGWGGIAD